MATSTSWGDIYGKAFDRSSFGVALGGCDNGLRSHSHRGPHIIGGYTGLYSKRGISGSEHAEQNIDKNSNVTAVLVRGIPKYMPRLSTDVDLV